MADHLDAASLVRTHQAAVWRYLRYLGADEAMADDLTQETFLKLLEHPPELRGHVETSAWLRTVARNNYLMALRRGSKTVNIEEFEQLEVVWQQHEGDDQGEGYKTALRDCLKTLAEKARRAIELQYAAEQSRADIAGALGLDPEGAKTLLRRAREHLRKCIEKKGL
ncbi:ECF RNA polymerase sigma factor SigM [Planctomycetaceae bacterium]|nr:ECF RNA polymerase sigma factor SigM [Planctomycetaceae bacterium]